MLPLPPPPTYLPGATVDAGGDTVIPYLNRNRGQAGLSLPDDPEMRSEAGRVTFRYVSLHGS